MARRIGTRRGASAAALLFFFLLMRAAVAQDGAEPGKFSAPEMNPPPKPSTRDALGPKSFRFDAGALTGEKDSPFNSSSPDPMDPWKELRAPEIPQEGSIIYQNPMATLRGGDAPPPPVVSQWQPWIVPGIVALGAAVFVGAAIAWRISVLRRMPQVSPRLVPPSRPST